MHERHTGQYQFDLVVTALDVIAPNWRYQLLFRIWFGAHQLDLVVKKAFGKLCNDHFLNIVTGVTGHLSWQQTW
jgi:hypothetical protein